MDQGSDIQVKHEASARVGVKSLGNQELTSAPLLHDATQCSAPKGWPTLPCRVQRPWYATLWSLAVDITLLTCSITFLAFAPIVNYYNEAPIAEHRTATDRLVGASKYVCSTSVRTGSISIIFRVQLYFRYSSQQSSLEQRTQSCSGD